MRGISNYIFMIAGFLVILAPFVFMPFFGNEESYEKREMSKLPNIDDHGTDVSGYMKALGEYFEDNFAFRNELVTANSVIVTELFMSSDVDSVTAGSNGWLYYSSSIDDYKNNKGYSDIKLQYGAYNLSLINEYVLSKGAKLLLCVPPNKNSLYDEHMPYYEKIKTSDFESLSMFKELVNKKDIPYVDLFAMFKSHDEVLYQKRDSHWSNKGAMLAYNSIMDGLKRDHETYETATVRRTKTDLGDLSRMVYPAGPFPEWNYEYEIERHYKASSENTDEYLIDTENETNSSSLLMYRDSFANTLIPFMAENFGRCRFSKNAAFALQKDIDEIKPEYVVIEKVERNLNGFCENIPIMPAIETDIPKYKDLGNDMASAFIYESDFDADYYRICGDTGLSLSEINPDCEIDVIVSSEDKTKCYKAFLTFDEENTGFDMYLEKKDLPEESAFKVIYKDSQQSFIVNSGKLDESE